MQTKITGTMLRKMIIAGASVLEQNKKTIDALNVFPVPDGDTGTNMFLTMKSAVAEVNACISNNIDALCDAYAKGSLRGARGNSGVITSQIIKGITSVLSKSKDINAKVFAKAVAEGSAVAYKAVTKPKEGTILTVIREMAEQAVETAKKVNDIEVLLEIILERGEDALARTPEMLPVLKKAGVVDAGGRGILAIFIGYYKAIRGEEIVYKIEDAAPSTYEDVVADYESLDDIEFGYCTEYKIINLFKKTTTADIDRLREKLVELGDSVVCVGDLELVKVHVHSNEPNMALKYALELGEIFDVKIENMLEQNRELKAKRGQQAVEMKPMGIVAVAPGKGIGDVFKELMIDELVFGGQTMNPSADDIAKSAGKVPAETVFILPNNKNIILAAEQAKTISTKKIIVIPTKSVPEGIAAALSFNPEASVEENTLAIKDAIKTVKSGAVTHAVRSTHVDGFDLSVGEIIGLDNKAILAKGDDVSSTTEQLIAAMMEDTMLNITLFYGEDVKAEDAELLKSALEAKYPDCEITCIFGGQPVYYYLISLE